MFGWSRRRSQIEDLHRRISDLEDENLSLRMLDEAIRRNTALFEALITNSSEGIALLDAELRIVRVVRAALGYSPRQVTGAPLETVIVQEDHGILAECFGKLVGRRAQTVEFEGRFRRPDGATGWMLAKFTDMLDDPNVQAIVCNYADVTERKMGERMAAEFAAIAEDARSAVFSTDPEGCILTWNPGARNLYGYDAAEIVGQHVRMLVPEEQREEEKRNRTEVGETAHPLEFRAMRVAKHGARIRAQVRLAPVLDRYGRACAILHASAPEPDSRSPRSGEGDASVTLDGIAVQFDSQTWAGGNGEEAVAVQLPAADGQLIDKGRAGQVLHHVGAWEG
jgi:PAS domain S-box-containing protein